MKILAYLKKQPKWQLSLREDGSIVCGAQGNRWSGARPGRQEQEQVTIMVPVFEATIKYDGYYLTQGSMRVQFEAKGDTMEDMLDVLKGLQPREYSSSAKPAMKIFDYVSSGKMDIHGDGWFTGIFTFSKQGPRVSLTPFEGVLEQQNLITTGQYDEV